jgi:hypothetical protein
VISPHLEQQREVLGARFETFQRRAHRPAWEPLPLERHRTEFQSYGDVFLSAKGKRGSGAPRTLQTTLGRALRRGHEGVMTPAIEKAILDIESN